VRAIDTNVVVRFLTQDDAAQFRRARAALEGGAIFISTTVLLESEWVLRSAYRFSARRIAASLRGLAGLPGVTLEEPALLAKALDALDGGMDFADALHLGKAEGCSAFLSFDRELAKAAARHSALTVEQP
jgi:predicted nucleic-acid-binding protein